MRLFFSKHELKLRRKRNIAAVVCVVIVLGVYWILTRPQKAAPEMPTVIVEPVIKDDVEIFGEYVGRIRAQQFVEVRARVEGYLENMLFAEGTYVNKNQVLFVINQDQYRAKADKARAQLKKDEAQALKAERDLKRIRPLYEQNAASQLDLDNAEAAYESAVATGVNAIVPGFLLTNQNRALLTNEDGSYTDRARTIIAHTPAGRFAEPEELLGTIHYLVSDASSFVTGALAVVDGGFDAFSI